MPQDETQRIMELIKKEVKEKSEEEIVKTLLLTPMTRPLDDIIKWSEDSFKETMLQNMLPVMRDGGIQFEFDGKNICAELEINPNGDSTFILFDDERNIVDKGQLFELSELTTLLEEAQYA